MTRLAPAPRPQVLLRRERQSVPVRVRAQRLPGACSGERAQTPYPPA